jgi:nicotinamidase-related amidase
MATNWHIGVNNLLAPDNCTLLLIDHQGLQFAGVQNIDGTLLINNVVGLTKTAKVFGVPTVLTTVLKHRSGLVLKDIQDVFPDQQPINRTTLNTWEDERVVNAIKKIGRKKLVVAALWTEICLAFPVLSALAEGYEVYIVTDASGGLSVEAHERAVQRMVQAGAVPITWIGFASELQRDWAREKTAAGIAEIMQRHGGSIGTSLEWEFQLLGSSPIHASR